MAQLDPSRYKRLGNPVTYGQSDGLYWDATASQLAVVMGDSIVARIDATGVTADLEFSSEARGDILRRAASAWAVHSAKASGQVLLGDGTDVVSTALSGDVTVNGSGVTAIGANKVLASMLGANLGKGHIPLDFTTAKIISADAIGNTTEGLFPDGNTDPSLARVNGATDKALRLIWGASSVVEVQFAPIQYPGDLDDTAAVTVHFLARMAGATDTPTLTVGYFENVGDTNAGGATGALSATIAEVSRTIAAADIGAHPNFANIVVTPGAHGTDALWMYAAWVEYTRKS